MRRFHIEATWFNDCVEVELDRITALGADERRRMLERGMLKPDDDPVKRRGIGRLRITEPTQMTPKGVRRAALTWLTEHAEMTDDDSYEMQLAVHDHLKILARLEAAVTG